MSNEITNHEAPVRKKHNGVAVFLIAIGALLLIANMTAVTVGRIARSVTVNIDDAVVEANADRIEAQAERIAAQAEANANRVEAQADRIAAQAEANAARVEAQAERIEQRIDGVVIPAVEDIRITGTGPRFVLGPFGPFFGPRYIGRFNRGPNLWGAAFLLLGLYFITRNRKQAQAVPATGPEADPPAAA